MKNWLIGISMLTISCSSSEESQPLLINNHSLLLLTNKPNRIEVLDIKNFTLQYLALPLAKKPYRFYLSEDSSNLFITNPQHDFTKGHDGLHTHNPPGELLKFELATQNLVPLVSTPHSNSHVLAFHNEIWTNQVSHNGRILVYDQSGKLKKEITVGSDPLDFMLSPDKRFLLAICEESSFLYKIDVNSYKVVAEIRIDFFPTGISIGSNDSLVLVENKNKNTINLINIYKEKTIQFIDTDFRPGETLYLQEKNQLLVLNPDSSQIQLFEHTKTKWQTIKKIKLNQSPSRIMSGEKKQYIYVLAGQLLYIFDRKTLNIIKEIKFDSYPIDLIEYYL